MKPGLNCVKTHGKFCEYVLVISYFGFFDQVYSVLMDFFRYTSFKGEAYVEIDICLLKLYKK